MSWFWIALTGLVGIGVGAFLGLWWAIKLAQPVLISENRNRASDRTLALSVLRRELANWMFRHDPDRYRNAYVVAHEAVLAIAMMDRCKQEQKINEIAEKLPHFVDFDLLGTKDYILYDDALDTYSYDDIERHYIDIVRFQALQTAVDGSWPCAGGTDADGLSHLDSYTRSYKDRLLRARMEDALSDFNIYRLAKADSQKQDIYETTVLTVRRINHFAELRFGIHFKDTNEFGLYGVFYGDRDEPYRSFYRSDSEFTKEISLRD